MQHKSGDGLSVVVVHQGSPGGIGQVERLFNHVLPALGAKITVVTRLKETGTSATMAAAPVDTKAEFGVRVLRTVIVKQPDLVLFTHLNLTALAWPIRMASPSSRIACVAHGIEAWRPLTLVSQLAIRALDTVWCVSEFTKGMLMRESAIPANKLHLLPLALLESRAQLIESKGRRRSGPRSNTCELVSVTRLDRTERYKGVEHTLLALAQLRSSRADFSYRLIGDGSDRPALEDFARRLGLGDLVRVEGTLDDDGLAEALNDCDVFILPSAKEGFGLAHLEAMCAGKPVIAAFAAATPELVDETVGALVRYADVEGLANGILRLMGSPSLRAELGDNGRSRYQVAFTQSEFQARLRELIGLL
jgi:phosphatidyl-myo-inositol dimannoside synthase